MKWVPFERDVKRTGFRIAGADKEVRGNKIRYKNFLLNTNG
jgi:hypothetical protein